MCEKQLLNKWKNARLCIFRKQNMMECENNVEMAKDLTNGIIGLKFFFFKQFIWITLFCGPGVRS